MKKFKRVTVFGLILCMMLFNLPVLGAGAGSGNGSASGPDLVPNKILVKFRSSTDELTKQQVHRANKASVVGEIKDLGVQVLQIPDGRVNETVLAYANNAAVEYAEPDYIARAFEVIPDDTYFDQQWGIAQIMAPQAWDLDTGSSNTKIAILDTGIDQDHEDLTGKITINKNFSDSSTVDDEYGHGTHVAGIAAAVTDNGTGVAGVGYNCSLMNIKVLNDSGSGDYSWIASGITWAADNGAKVINMSLGGKLGSKTLQNAVNYAWNKGVVVVAAAGNNGNSRPSYPAYYSNCIAVAASDINDAKASFSNYGDWVDVAAPGVNIYSTLPNHANAIGMEDYGSLSGTSMSTPYVAGLAALIWTSAYGDDNAGVRSRIESTADESGSIWSDYGIERINAYNAVRPNDDPPAERVLDVYTDKSLYTGNTWVYITVEVKDSKPLPGVNVDLTVTTPDLIASSYTGTTDSAGKVLFNYRVLKSSVKGTYTINASAGTISDTTTFNVQ